MSNFRFLPPSSAKTATPSPRKDGPPPRPTQALPSAVPRRNFENRQSIPKQKLALGLPIIKEASEDHDPEILEIQPGELIFDKESSRDEGIHEVSPTASGFIEVIAGATETLATPCKSDTDAIVEIKELILAQCLDAQTPLVRVQILNLFYHAAGGKDSFLKILHPEIEAFTRTLTALLDDDRFAYLTALKNAFKPYLSKFQDDEILEYLESIKKAGNHISNRGIRNNSLRGLSKMLITFMKEELALAEQAKKVKEMIATNREGKWNDTARALAIIYFAAGGQVHINPEHPETTLCSEILRKLPLHERLEHLERFYTALKSHFTQAQDEMIERSLSTLRNQSQTNRFGRASFFDLKTLLRKEFIELFKEMITKNTDERENGTVRALKVFYFTVGGQVHVNPRHPETALYAEMLSDLSVNERLECLEQLYEVLGSYFTEAQKQIIKNDLSKLTKRSEGNNLDHSSFLDLEAALGKQLEALSVDFGPT